MNLRDDAVMVVLQNRWFLYALFERIFASEPDWALVNLLRGEHVRDEFCLLDGGGQAENLLKSALGGAARENEEALEVLREEYTRLFIGPAKLPAPPWESVYVSPDHLLFQASTLAVREAYAKEGFQAAGYPHEADDHIATEFGFMAALAKRAIDAYDAGDFEACRAALESQACFLEEHLLLWVREFSNRVGQPSDKVSCKTSGKAFGASAFYPSFAVLAADACERDAKVIEELRSAL